MTGSTTGPREHDVVVLADARVLAAAAAARFVTAVTDAQAEREVAHVVLTGGGIGIALLAAVAQSPARDAVDWGRVHVWWGDERFLPAGDPERNETQAREALLDHVPLDPAHVHAMAPSDGPHGNDVHAAARAYADDLAAHAAPGDDVAVPAFDVLILGVGPDGHVASLFPGHPGTQVQDRTVIGVEGSPKPPPVRISLTFPALRHAREVWLIASGEAKSAPVGLALSGAGADLPCAGAAGRRRTVWLLDRDAAGRVP